MKFAYKFSNLLGTIYRKGTLLFSPDGNSVISPVGNRITIYDLKNNKSSTLPVESRFNYTTLDLSPNGCTLVAVNEVGEAHLISTISNTIVHKYHFKRPVHCLRFSPDGKHFAACKDNNVFVFKSPGLHTGEFNPFIMERVFHGSFDETTCLDWSSDSRVLAVGSKDMSTKLYPMEKFANFSAYSLGSHSDALVAVFFEKSSLDMMTLSSNAQCCVWECNIGLDQLRPVGGADEAVKRSRRSSDSEEDDVDTTQAGREQGDLEVEEALQQREEESEDKDGKDVEDKLFYKRLARHYLGDLAKMRGVKLMAACYHQDTHILVTGFNNGSFLLHEMPDVNLIHSLSISQQQITSVAVNNTGDWIALGCSGQGQLLVWEWQSETYVMKQQGHFNNMNCLGYSPDGQYIVTGGDDGKVKLWNTNSGFCYVTFHEHTSGITAVRFSPNRKFVISASLDGTVRAFDLTRYRNFRTFTSPRPVQFSCLAIDSGSEYVAAGGQDVFDVYLWSMRIGRLLEILSGHEGPVVGIAFCPSPGSSEMASVSWDKTVKIWNAVETGSAHETIQLTTDGLCVTYKPDGEEVAVATLDGQISFFHCRTSRQVGSIEGRNDLGSGRSETDLITAKKNLQGKAFMSLCYTADGNCILAGGQSKNVCIYNVKEAMLLKKFEITQNRSFDAVDDFINRRKMTEFGTNLGLVEERDELEGGKVTVRLPGVKRGDMASRAFKPEVRVSCLQFSPTGQAWAASTTEGLLVYALDAGLMFDPFQLDLGVTPDSVRTTLRKRENTRALMMALKLNEHRLIQEVFEGILPAEVELAVTGLPEVYVQRALKFAAAGLETTRHIEFYLGWIQSLLTFHGPRLGGKTSSAVMPILLLLQKNLTRKHEDLCKVCDFNKYSLQVVERLGMLREQAKEEDEEAMDTDEELLTVLA